MEHVYQTGRAKHSGLPSGGRVLVNSSSRYECACLRTVAVHNHNSTQLADAYDEI